MNLKSFSARLKINLIAGITAIVFLVYFQQVVMADKMKEVAALQVSIRLVKEKLNLDQLAYLELQKRAPASVETGIAGQLLDQYLKFNGHFSSVVSGIVSSSNGNSFALTKILAENQIKTVGYTQTLYSVEADASFISIGKFLEKMEDSPLLTEVDSIDITRIESEMKRCKAKIKLFSYVGAE